MHRWGITFLRIVVGTVFLMHGGQKLFVTGFHGVAVFLGHLGFPYPLIWSVILILAEFLGGIALIVGLFTRWVAAILAIEMTVALVKVHLHGGFFLPHGFEFVLTLLAANLCLALSGAGMLALDNIMGRKG
jgi:putative oxidoreductase